MYKIIEEQTIYFYFTKGETISDDLIEKIPYFNKEAFDLVSDSNVSRNILIPHWSNDTFFLEHLYWNDKSDLITLDERIKNGNFKNSDFHNSIKTIYEKIKCPNCKEELNGLSIDSGGIYPMSSIEFTQKKISNFIKVIQKCPNCNSSTRRCFLYYFK